VSTPEPDLPLYPPLRPSLTVEELLAVKGAKPIRSLDEVRAGTFEDEAELKSFQPLSRPNATATSPEGCAP
jgi:hypothetical protein